EKREETGKILGRKRETPPAPPSNDYEIGAEQGTAALETLEDVPELDFLLVPTSGSGLLAGCAVAAKHLRPQIRVFGVEPEAGNDTWQSFRKGERVEIPVPKTIADGLQVTAPGKLTFPIIRELVQDNPLFHAP